MKTFIPLLLLFLTNSPMEMFAQNTINLLVGTYTNTGKSKGIYVYDFDVATGRAVLKNQAEAVNPSFLTMSTDHKFVYSVAEVGDGQGAANAYAFDEATGKLTLLNQQPVQASGPCHITTDRKGRYVIVSNYGDGKISVFPIAEDGRLGPIAQLIQHEGSGPNTDRQKGPHVHSAFFSPDEKLLYVQDLGTDKVNIYRFQPENEDNPLVAAAQPFVKSSPGGGPRHAAVSADGRYVYLVEEMIAKVMVYAWNDGRLEPIQEVDINEDGYQGANGAADIKLSPDGRFLYASNRGDAHTLAIYRVNSADGQLTKVGNQSVLGQRPRNFNITPDGRYLLVANQGTDNVVVFARDLDTGLLTDTGHRINVGAPVCLVF